MEQQDMANITTEEEKIQQLLDFLKEMSTDKTMLTQFVQQKDFSFENIITSTPKSELRKYIRYSLEVWVPTYRLKLHHNLNIHEKRILESKQFLFLFVLLLYVPSQQLRSLRDGQFT